jgi:hypothetical protein
MGGLGLAIWWRFELSECRRARSEDAAAAGQALEQAIQDGESTLRAAQASAQRYINTELARLQRPAPDVAQERQRAQARIAHLEAALTQAQASLTQALASAADAEHRRRNATATAERRRRKLARLTGSEP